MFSELARFFGLKTSQKTKPVADDKNSKEPEKIINEEPVENHTPIAKESAIEKEVTAKPNKTIHTKKNIGKSKNGVPVLSEDFDFSSFFEDEHECKNYNEDKKQEQVNISKKHLNDQYSEFNPVKTKKIVPIKTDKKGIPRLSSYHDLETLMISGIEGIEKTEIQAPLKRQKTERQAKKALKDKNKIDILSESIDLTKAFGSDPERDEFHELLSRNIEGKSQEVLLREKKEKTEKPKPVPVEQRIKRYPGPQENIDLHGFTAMEADRKTDIFIRSARRRGIFTVKIIVGKGIHSQGRAVLPDVVEDRLSALKNENEILTFRWEKRLKTQSGAVIVYLNQYD